MKKIISYQFAKDLGLLEDPYQKRKIRAYPEQYIFEGWHQAEHRRELAEIGIQRERDAQMKLPNCVDEELELFEFEEEDILKSLVPSEERKEG